MARYWICAAHKDENDQPLRFTDQDKALRHRQDKKIMETTRVLLEFGVRAEVLG